MLLTLPAFPRSSWTLAPRWGWSKRPQTLITLLLLLLFLLPFLVVIIEILLIIPWLKKKIVSIHGRLFTWIFILNIHTSSCTEEWENTWLISAVSEFPNTSSHVYNGFIGIFQSLILQRWSQSWWWRRGTKTVALLQINMGSSCVAYICSMQLLCWDILVLNRWSDYVTVHAKHASSSTWCFCVLSTADAVRSGV